MGRGGRSRLTHSKSRDNQEIKPGSRRSFVLSRPLLARDGGGGDAANLPPTIFYTIFYLFLPPSARLSQACGIGRGARDHTEEEVAMFKSW